MTTGIVELTDLNSVKVIEQSGRWVRVDIEPADQLTFSLGSAEWFCKVCCEMVEDPGAVCWCTDGELYTVPEL